MLLVDAGPLVAILNRNDPDHAACRRHFDALKVPPVTTWPVLTEAMYFLYKHGGVSAQNLLWGLLLTDAVRCADLVPDDYAIMQRYMEKYRDHPMDLADATLVALAERKGTNRIFTLDERDFRVYRLRGKESFEIVPAPKKPARKGRRGKSGA